MTENNRRLKFSIVTPTFNGDTYLEKTISSVVTQQGDFDIEYIIVDNESTDETLRVAEAFKARLNEFSDGRAGRVSLTVVSKKDNSMYEAINRGFALATGNVFAWINADDLYLPGAFDQVASAFTSLPQVRWVKGVTSYIDEQGRDLGPGKCFLYSQALIRHGLYGREAYFIQQDSVFWRADLWNAVCGIDPTFRLAGDYDLWLKFAQKEPLYVMKYPVSCFRRVKGQLSEDLAAYREEQQRCELDDNLRVWLLRGFFSRLEKNLPDWLNFIVFRVLCPFDPLYYIENGLGSLRIKKSSKYKV